MHIFRSRRNILVIIIAIILICLILFVAFNIDNWLDSRVDSYEKDSSIVMIDGQRYKEKNLRNYLVIGLDTYDPLAQETMGNNNEMADFVALLSLDDNAKTYSILHLNRDSMVDVDELGITGERTGSIVHTQLCVSHGYGNGGEQSCLNVKRAVSRLLCGLSIDRYVALSMDAVGELNDSVGGVTVTMPDDYTYLDPAFVKDADVTLIGEQAMAFVRPRMQADDGTNIARMKRQRAYVDGFMQSLKAQENLGDDYFEQTYKNVASKGAIVTDCSVYTIESVVETISGYTFKGIFSPEGTAEVNNGYMEFTIDQNSLNGLVTSLYYDKYN